MKARLALCLALCAVSLPGHAQDLAPFLPAPKPPRLIKVLAPTDFIDRASVEAFERAAGWTVALDNYASPAELAQRSAEQNYDVVLLRGPALARRLAAKSLTRLDRARLPNARLVNPVAAAKYAAYDRDGGFGVPYGWSAFGLIYDADKMRDALGGPPVSWAQALGLAREARLASGCGIVWPDAAEESFLLIWRLTGRDPGRATAADLKSAAALLERARAGFQSFAVADEVGALAKGSACLGAGTAGDAAAAVARGGDAAPPIRFAYPREGALLTLYAFAIPRDAAAPDAAYRLIDALLAPEAARRDARKAGIESAEDDAETEALKRLAPEPVLDAALLAGLQGEWKRLTSAK